MNATRWPLAALLAAAVVGSAAAEPKGGSFERTNTVQGFYTMTYRIKFVAGKPAVVEIDGDGDTPLALVIEDEKGGKVASDYSDPDSPRATWTPAAEGPFAIKIVNRGGVPNRFRMKAR